MCKISIVLYRNVYSVHFVCAHDDRKMLAALQTGYVLIFHPKSYGDVVDGLNIVRTTFKILPLFKS